MVSNRIFYCRVQETSRYPKKTWQCVIKYQVGLLGCSKKYGNILVWEWISISQIPRAKYVTGPQRERWGKGLHRKTSTSKWKISYFYSVHRAQLNLSKKTHIHFHCYKVFQLEGESSLLFFPLRTWEYILLVFMSRKHFSLGVFIEKIDKQQIVSSWLRATRLYVLLLISKSCNFYSLPRSSRFL